MCFYRSILLGAVSFLFAACSNPFTSTYSDRHEATVARQEIVAQTQTSYHLRDIPSCSGSLLVAPDDPVLDRIVSILSQAHTHIDLEVYILTEKKIIDALIDAHRRGVAVRVLLERNVFGSRGMNSKSAKQLTDAGIPVFYADNTTYKLTHAKYLVADDTYIVSTGNMSHSTFTKNREYFWIGDDSSDRSVLSRVFTADTGSGHTDIVSGSGLVLSPWDSRAKLDILIKEAKTSLLVTNQSIEDKTLVDDLVAAQARGVDVRVVTEDTAAKSGNEDSTTSTGTYDPVAVLRSRGIRVTALRKPYIHAKAVLIDGQYIFVGSQNFTRQALDENREVGILCQSPDMVKKYQSIFESDFWRKDWQK